MRTSAIVFAAASATASAHVDWRETGCVQDVVDAGHLATDDVASSVESVACLLANRTGKYVQLSTQQVEDCASTLGEFGQAFEYITENGLETEAAYPSSINGSDVNRKKCIYDASLVVVDVELVGGSAKGDSNEKYVEEAVRIAPVSAAFAVGTEFELYTGGVISQCAPPGTSPNHIMEIVGFTDHDPDQNNTAYWIVKNTWGKNWGIDGYAHIAKDVGACGLHDPTYIYPKNITIPAAKTSPKKYLK